MACHAATPAGLAALIQIHHDAHGAEGDGIGIQHSPRTDDVVSSIGDQTVQRNPVERQRLSFRRPAFLQNQAADFVDEFLTRQAHEGDGFVLVAVNVNRIGAASDGVGEIHSREKLFPAQGIE